LTVHAPLEGGFPLDVQFFHRKRFHTRTPSQIIPRTRRAGIGLCDGFFTDCLANHAEFALVQGSLPRKNECQPPPLAGEKNFVAWPIDNAI